MSKKLSKLFFPVILFGLLLSACASPSVKSFSDSTTLLALAVAQEQDELLLYSEKVLTQMKSLDAFTPSVQRFTAAKDKSDQQAKDTKAVFEFISSYSNSLVNLVESGQKGGEAVKKIKSNIDGILTALSATPLGISKPVLDILETLGKVFSQEQSRKGLIKAMEAAQPTIELIAANVAGLSAEQKTQIFSLATLQQSYWTTFTGHNVIAVGEDAADWQNKAAGLLLTKEEQIVDCLNNNSNCDEINEVVKKINDLLATIDVLKPQYEQYFKESNAINNWKNERLKVLDVIPKAAEEWAKAHAEVLQKLKDCSTFASAFQKKCGALTANNLNYWAGLIKNATAKKGAEQ